jgi:hypothetical protein
MLLRGSASGARAGMIEVLSKAANDAQLLV